MARIKIVLRQPVNKLGEVGDIVSVAGGYARNFLIPRGLAVPANKGNIKQADSWKRSRTAKQAKELADAEALKAKLEGRSIVISAQAGPDGRMFGSITTSQVADAIKSSLGIDVDRHSIALAAPIRHLGVHEVEIPIHEGVSAKLTIEATQA